MYVDPSGNNPSLNEEVISLTMATLLSVSVGLCLRNLMVACINMRDQMNFPDVGTTVEILKNKMVGIQKDFASGWEILWVPEVIKETIIDGIPAKVQEVMIEVFPAIKQEVMIEVFPATTHEGLLIIPGPYVVERNFWDNFTVNMRKDILESGRYSHTQNLDGLNEVRNHLTNDVDGLDFEPNKAMMNKIEEMLANNQELTGAYKDFYEHELTESMLMKQGYDYNIAHNMALEIHNVQPQALYSPEIVQEYSKWFNKSDFEYWGISK